MKCEAIILRPSLRRCGALANWQIETLGHAPVGVCYVCREETLGALRRAGYRGRIVPVTDGERRAK